MLAKLYLGDVVHGKRLALFRITRETAGLLVALVFSAPFLVWGALVIARGEYVSTTKLGLVIRLSGAPATAVGVAYVSVGISVIAVALAQWPSARAIWTVIAVFAGLSALMGVGVSLFS